MAVSNLLVLLRGRGLFGGDDAEARRVLEDARAGRDGVREPDVATDDGAAADDRLASEDGRAGVDDHVVLDGRVALGVADELPRGVLVEGEGAERHALVELDARADDGRAADDDARTVVDEEGRADARPRVDVDPRPAVRVLGHDAR